MAVKLTKEFTQLEKSAVKLTVTIEKKEVVDFYNSTVAKYVKNAQIPGFRKGHVPASVLERKYGDSLKADTLSELIDKSLGEIFDNETENRPLPYAQPVLESLPELDTTKEELDTANATIAEKDVALAEKDALIAELKAQLKSQNNKK